MSTPSPSDDEKIVKEAHRQFAACVEREGENNKAFLSDLKFAKGDPDNGWQWDDAKITSRQKAGRPCLTINKTAQHNRQITNDARQNKPCIRVYPVDSGADKETADVFNGIIRHIESVSSADTAYDTASELAVNAGLGYWRITTDYVSDQSFDQEIYIKACPNPLNVFLIGYSEADGSDATGGIIFEDIPRDEFKSRFPKAEPDGWDKDSVSDWVGEETIRVAEYFKTLEEKDTLYAMPDGTTLLLSSIEDKEMAKAIKADKGLKSRPVTTKSIKWYLIAGEELLEKRDWPGIYVPIVRVVGEEFEVEGKKYRRGHTRSLKDAARMYNYNSSASVEYGALQTKIPWVASAEATAGYEEFWDNAHTANFSRLPYNERDKDGNQTREPHRPLPPAPAQLFLQGMQTAAEEMKMASGQYDASMGSRSNETSGRAILARQRQGDTATFHFIDNVARAIKYTGRILIDLIPKIYDTQRVVRIIGDDGSEEMVEIDPSQESAVTKQNSGDGIKNIYNPSVGRYDLTVSVGPSYGSKRAEAFQALTEMATRNPQIMQIAGDLVMRAADFPMAEELAERFEKTLAPGLKDDEGQPQIPPQVQQQLQQSEQQTQQMQQHIQMLEGSLKEIGEKYNQLHEKSEHDRETRLINSYVATTDRIKLILPHLGPDQIAQLADNVGLDIASEPDINALVLDDEQPPHVGGRPV